MPSEKAKINRGIRSELSNLIIVFVATNDLLGVSINQMNTEIHMKTIQKSVNWKRN